MYSEIFSFSLRVIHFFIAQKLCIAYHIAKLIRQHAYKGEPSLRFKQKEK